MTEALPTKKCFKCGEVKTLSDFYKHSAMADGHVNKCKVCNKKDVSDHREVNLEKIREYDRGRRKKCNVSSERWQELSGKEKDYQLRNYEDMLVKKRDYLRKYREENPKKSLAHRRVRYAIKLGVLTVGVCEVCGDSHAQGHHCDYDKPLDVMWLCPEHHQAWHTKHGQGLNG